VTRVMGVSALSVGAVCMIFFCVLAMAALCKILQDRSDYESAIFWSLVAILVPIIFCTLPYAFSFSEEVVDRTEAQASDEINNHANEDIFVSLLSTEDMQQNYEAIKEYYVLAHGGDVATKARFVRSMIEFIRRKNELVNTDICRSSSNNMSSDNTILAIDLLKKMIPRREWSAKLNLRHLCFSGYRIYYKDMETLDFSGSVFVNTEFKEADLRNSLLASVKFIGGKMASTRFDGANVSQAEFWSVDGFQLSVLVNARNQDHIFVEEMERRSR
jgi:hypothetical protein